MTYQIKDIKKIKQLKMVTGEEVLCEIIEETDEDLIVRAPLGIQFHTSETGTRIWTFRLFMCYQDDVDRFVLIKVDKIMGIANPIDELVKQYLVGIDQMFVFDDMIFDDDDDDFFKDSDGGNGKILQFPTVH
jgi:hypothetical protein